MSAVLELIGPLTFETVTPVLARGVTWIKKHKDGCIDFSQVTRTDSAGVALLIEWTRFAKQKNHSLHFIHLPEQLLAIIRVSGLDTILK
jgi:phospholipid transport system transporter-binding protein